MPPALRRVRLLAWQEVDTVIDVGANAGQYGLSLRAAGYQGRLVSFEPLSEALTALGAVTELDPLWECHRLALGASPATVNLNVSRDLQASSVLPMEDRHVRHCPASEYVGIETVIMSRLDSLCDLLPRDATRIHLKLDVQGYELRVLEGSADLLPRVATVEAEMSLVPLYRGGPLYRELIDDLDARGFLLASVEGITEEPDTGHMLQMDGLFVRVDSLSR